MRNVRDTIENAKALAADVKPTFPVGRINDDRRSDYPKVLLRFTMPSGLSDRSASA